MGHRSRQSQVGPMAGQSETVNVRIVWWESLTNLADLQWSTNPPHCREMACDVLGVWSTRRVRFSVHAVLPCEPLPPMNRTSRPLFVKAVKQALVDKLAVGVDGCNMEITDWEGSDGR